MTATQTTLEQVQNYYGTVLQSSQDLKTGACCSTQTMPTYLREIVRQIHPEVQEKFYGCGSPIPQVLEGATVLDLGCGSGRDCFILSRLVGPTGRVIGVDMTEAQLAVARGHVSYHTRQFGYEQPNVEFLQGYIENLASLGIASASVDIVISNCVLNLSPDKERAFAEIFRVLKPGGELFFSDVFAGRRVPPSLTTDPVLRGECLAGALYTEDFRRLMARLGCLDYRVVAGSPVALNDPQVAECIGMVDFYSYTIRAFKLDLEDRCEDYGQVAYYLGTIPEAPHSFLLDDHHLFKTGQPHLVCGNTAAMLSETRYHRHFRVVGDRSIHFGLFDCAPATPSTAIPGGACC
ncbi:methyltransferase domain-containing protein [Anthocerotibacter panamensis]|uniref:methyltransferase domain-containing protein n=1 Tax=Anthocerotibacter panamensis TaxID=2857077 RepID=UPI001C40563B|nr:methyltransferase domain-containing protein [Anthocerotibacter panamensis]